MGFLLSRWKDPEGDRKAHGKNGLRCGEAIEATAGTEVGEIMRKLFITDIHGCYNEMIALLEQANYQPGIDQLVVGGDMVDRGPHSAHVLRQLKSLQERYPETVIVLSGNHEDMMGMFLAGHSNMWFSHGKEAIDSFDKEFNDTEFDEHLGWAISRPFIHQDDEYVYVHAGLIPALPLGEQPRQECLWMPYTQMGLRFSDFEAKHILECTGNRKVVYGHTPKNYIFDDGARICCDLGAAVKPQGAKLALVDLTAGRYWYYDFDSQEIKKRTISTGRVTV